MNVYCSKCGRRVYSLVSQKKELCADCDANKSHGGMSDADRWLKGVLNA